MIRQTSKEALKSILGVRDNLKRRVFDAISASGVRGCTADELYVMFEDVSTRIHPRVTDLHQDGLIYRTKRIRLSRSGRPCAVYRARKKLRPLATHTCPLCDSKISGKQARKVREHIDVRV